MVRKPKTTLMIWVEVPWKPRKRMAEVTIVEVVKKT
jgi:hypothetical protein